MLNVHIYPSPFKFESRILKETRSIIDLGLASSVLIISRGERENTGRETIGQNVVVHRIKTITAQKLPKNRVTLLLDYLEFYFRVFFFSLRLPVKIINSHSLMVLPVSVAIKLIKGAKLIYDPHELETERIGLRGFSKRLSKIIERVLIRWVDSTIVVSPSIENWYRTKYDLKKIVTVRNVPQLTPHVQTNVFREKLNISDDDLIFIYQGLFMPGRSIELFLSVFKRLTPDKHLVLMGYGPLEEFVKSEARKYSNVHYYPAVSPSDILFYTASADVGIHTPENCCLSYYYSLPNKFFEYIMAEIPLLVSDFPDMAGIVRKNQIGWPVAVTEGALFDTINQVTKQKIRLKKERLREIKSEYSWEKEEERIKEAFNFTKWN